MKTDCFPKAGRLLVFSVLAFGFMLLLQACSSEKSWTQNDKENVEHFFKSIEAKQAATLIINKLSSRIIPQEDIQEILRYQRIALQEAQLVTDDVLNKAHPELREHFRYEYQKGLDLFIKSLEAPDFAAQITGSSLLDQWSDWLNAHRQEIRIPSQRAPALVMRDGTSKSLSHKRFHP